LLVLFTYVYHDARFGECKVFNTVAEILRIRMCCRYEKFVNLYFTRHPRLSFIVWNTKGWKELYP